MSRVGKKIIEVFPGMNVNVTGQNITVEKSSKKLDYTVPDGISVKFNENKIVVSSSNDKLKPLHGLARTIIYNMVLGIHEGFKKSLQIVGRGKKAKVQGTKLILDIGFSHSAVYEIPNGIEIKVEKNIIEISGIDKQKVGEVASEIRAIQPPEPYKGAGIRYKDENIKKKAGKSAVGGGFSGAGK